MNSELSRDCGTPRVTVPEIAGSECKNYRGRLTTDANEAAAINGCCKKL